MFKIKICGVKLKSDIDAVGESPADAIGLNFFRPSVRYVDPLEPSTLELTRRAASLGLMRVGVFVNEPLESIVEIARAVDLDVVQLHGDETLTFAQSLQDAGIRVIRAIKVPVIVEDRTQNPVVVAVGEWGHAGFHLLLDADAGPQHGGSGKSIDWQAVHAWSAQNPEISWTLAGGLRSDNVAQAIAASGACSVDTASGVESSRGVKSAEMIRQFAAAAEAALAQNRPNAGKNLF
ncbi:phosphoribosylanthranilate isomerase [Stieleria varia]|uniref:N-(5'-phosphoribosyl)anthranilate isomerase n=1 Tax=Stieleria varia TaxID=2528005 RepID=A0A5C6AU68_9BACT|nr:phosphoribosylanthranilate isomerase [Stieleria varia]TWU02749.1 N-(5'-phosphoribosyl)anthranilate isomerase [Stieleria varia]